MADSISTYFADLSDPRHAQGRRHHLTDLIALTICAVVCGADSWAEVEDFGHAKADWLRTFLPLPHGIPSHDTLGRLFAALDPEAFEGCLIDWMAGLADVSDGRLIAIDGKTLRRSFDAASDRAAIHMVNAWCRSNHLALGQLATEEKSNEITAIPKLLDLLDLQDAIVTLDAMGCQRDIAEKIIQRGGDYILQAKANQGTLHQQLKLTLDEAIALKFQDMPYDRARTTDGGHGRIESRRLWCTRDIEWVPGREAWPGLRSVACLESKREIDGRVSTERRYYLSSLAGEDAEAMLEAVRGHWGIENQLHWSLDVTFGEDESRVRKGHAAENLSRLRRLALGLLKRETTFRAGLKRKRLRCAMDHAYLLEVLTM